jgi:hypothetical protein
MAGGSSLRILDECQFEVISTADHWKTTQKAISRSLGSTGYSAGTSSTASSRAVEWTLHWPEQDAWLGYNIEVKVVAV